MIKASPAPLSEYERQRALNIARNEHILNALGVIDAAKEVKAALPAARKREHALPKQPRLKKQKGLEPVRRSLRVRGLSPSGEQAESESRTGTSSGSGAGDAKKQKRDPSIHNDELLKLLERLRDIQRMKDRRRRSVTKNIGTDTETATGGDNNLSVVCDFKALQLDEEHVAKVLKERIFSVTFLPLRYRKIVAAGDKAGHICLWDVAQEEGKTEQPSGGTYDFAVHEKPVSGLACGPNDATKLYSCSYDGSLYVLDIDRSIFDNIHSDKDVKYTACALAPSNFNALYLADAEGGLAIVDIKSKKTIGRHDIHGTKVTSIDFHPYNDRLVATSSIDTTVCLWDTRKLGTQRGRKHSVSELATLNHARGVHSAYFSPDGNQLASTSYDGFIRVWKGVTSITSSRNKERLSQMDNELIKIPHNNRSEWWMSPFRAVWAWDSSHLLIAGWEKTVDVISVSTQKTVLQLRSPLMNAVPARLAVHPMYPALAGGSNSGRVYVWE